MMRDLRPRLAMAIFLSRLVPPLLMSFTVAVAVGAVVSASCETRCLSSWEAMGKELESGKATNKDGKERKEETEREASVGEEVEGLWLLVLLTNGGAWISTGWAMFVGVGSDRVTHGWMLWKI